MRSFRLFPCWLAVPLLLITAGGAGAQQDSVVGKVDHDQQRWLSALLKVEGDDRVRVEVPRNILAPHARFDIRVRERVELRQPVFFPESIDFSEARLSNHALDVANVPRPLPVSQVFRLEASRSSMLAGALLGGVVVGAVGITTGFAEACPPYESDSCVGDFEMVARAVGGAALGAFVGALVGRGITKWKTIYTAGPVPRKGVIHR